MPFVRTLVALLGLALGAARPALAEPPPATESPDTAVVYLYRRSTNPTIPVTVRVNGEPMGRLWSQSYFRWELAPGTYHLFARSQTNAASLSITVEPGRTRWVELAVVLGFQIRVVKLRERTAAQGSEAFQGLTRLTAPTPSAPASCGTAG